MDYDFRNKSGHPPPYNTSSSSQYPPIMYGHSTSYPKVNHQQPSFPPLHRPAPYNHPSSAPPPSSSTSSGLGIRVSLKPAYRIPPPPQLTPQVGDIPHSNFQFDFELERKILAEAEKESQNWSRFGVESLPSKPPGRTYSSGPSADPIAAKYIASGLNREAVPLAIAQHGDNPEKVKEFANGYTLLREMGFSSNSVAEALIMYDNDTDRALAYFLNNPS